MTQHPGQGRTALLVIDMQNSYFDFPELEEQRESVTEKVNELIAAAREGGCPILLIRTQHERDRSTWTVNMHDDGQGFAFPGTEQSEYVAGLDTEGGTGLVKTRDSAFFDTDLAARLRNLGATHLMLCGISITLAVSLNLINGFTGQFSIGHAGFMAVGAYSSAYFTFYHGKAVEASFGFLGETVASSVVLIGAGAIGSAALPAARGRSRHLGRRHLRLHLH